jgi:hypothetical protein
LALHYHSGVFFAFFSSLFRDCNPKATQALNKLTITKSLDNKRTLLHYLAEHIGKASPVLFNFCYTVVALLLQWCYTVVTLLHFYYTTALLGFSTKTRTFTLTQRP